MPIKLTFKHNILDGKAIECEPCNLEDIGLTNRPPIGNLAITIAGETVDIPISEEVAKKLYEAQERKVRQVRKADELMWTNLKTKRPPKNGDYLCMVKSYGNPYMGVMRYKSKGTLIEDAMTPYNLMDDIWVCVGGTTEHMNDFITHWMPLPDSPSNTEQ